MAFFNRTAAKEQIESLTEQLESVTADHAAMADQVETLKESIVTKDESISSLTKELRESQAMTAEFETENKALTEQLEGFEEKVESRAIEISASAGHEPIATIEADEQTDTSFQSLYDQARKDGTLASFIRENKTLIKNELTK